MSAAAYQTRNSGTVFYDAVKGGKRVRTVRKGYGRMPNELIFLYYNNFAVPY